MEQVLASNYWSKKISGEPYGVSREVILSAIVMSGSRSFMLVSWSS